MIQRRPLTRDEVRRVDQVAIERWGVPGVLLMENAGRGIADVMCTLGIEGLVVIVCAKGNNGGDGFVIARHLHLRGHAVSVVLACEASELGGDALVNYDLLRRTSVPVHAWKSTRADKLESFFGDAEWLVDAMLGTGANGEPREPMQTILIMMNRANVKRLAVDVPTGLDSETGFAANNAFRADHTCTLVAEKVGFINPDAKRYLGEVHTLDIGLPWELVLQAIGDA